MSAHDPDAMAEARRRALAASGQPSPAPASQPLAPWERDRPDPQQVARQAGRLQVEERREQAARAREQGTGWASRAEQLDLVSVGADGTPLADVPRAVDMKPAEEYGELSKHAIAVINKSFAHQDCSELHFDAPDKIFAKVRGERVKLDVTFDAEDQYTRFIVDLIRQADTPHTWEDIQREGWAVIRMAGGNRMLIWTPPLVENIHVAIHKVVARTWDMGNLVENGTLTPNMANLLVAAVKSRANILICGEMGAGKSVMLSLLAQNIADNERIALIEEVPEIFMDNPDITRITYNLKNGKGDVVNLAGVLDGALYGRYDRVIIGELHDKGAYRMLRVMATGGDGSLCTFHAGDARSALEQVRNHVLLEYPQMPPEVVAHFVRQAINIVVVVERIDGVHRVKEIAEVEWRNLVDASQVIGTNQLFAYDRKGEMKENPVKGQVGHIPVGRPDEDGKLKEKAERYGVLIDPKWFPTDTFGSARW